MTTEEFIKKSKIIHNNKYEYPNTIYESAKKQVEILCPKHGLFWQTPDSHMQGCNCKLCGFDLIVKNKTKSNENFIKDAIKVHGDKYDYSKVIYKKAIEKVIIVCKIHGEFLQTPNSHLNGSGCLKCGYLSKNRSLNTNYFIEKAIKIHDSVFDYSNVNYISAHNHIEIICKTHGIFLQTPNSHLSGAGCNKCQVKKVSDLQRKTTNQFIEEANIIHENKYDYSLTEYETARKKVKIICPIHGEFEQLTGSHLAGRGCSQCGFDFCNFKKSNWINRSKGRKGIFYIIRCWNENEEFFKFGITFQSIKIRYSGKTHMPYNYEIIRELKSENLSYIWDLERRFKRFKKKNHYKPLIHFLGDKYECFK